MRGQIAINLTWLFAVIAGIVLFGGIIWFATNQVGQGDLESGAAVLENIYNEMVALAKTKNTYNTLDTPNIRLRIMCEDPVSSGLMLEGAPNVKETRYQVIFGPDEIEGNLLAAWSRDWNVPFTVDRFLYLAGPETLFVIVRDSQNHFIRFQAGIPSQFDTDVIDGSQVSSYNRGGFDRYVFVFFPSSPTAPLPSAPSLQGEVRAVTINHHPNDDRGGLRFFNASGGTFQWDNQVSQYIGEAMMYGAIFSAGRTTFECNKEKALVRLQLMSSVNARRAALLRNASMSRECKDIINGSGAPINALDALYIRMEQAASAPVDVNEIGTVSAELRNVARDLSRGRNCPTL